MQIKKPGTLAYQGFTTSDVVRLTGLSRRQLSYWDRTGLFKPSILQSHGRGSRRVYSFLDLVQLRVLKKLLDGGLSRRCLGRWLACLRANISDNALASGTFMILGKKPLMICEPGEPRLAIDLARKGQLVWLIGLGAIAEQLEKEAKKSKGMRSNKKRGPRRRRAGQTVVA